MLRSRKAALVGALLHSRSSPAVSSSRAASQREGALLLDQVMSLVSDRYVDTLPTRDVYEKAARGLVRELNDPYSELLTPKRSEAIQQPHQRPLRRTRHAASRTESATRTLIVVAHGIPEHAG